MQKLGFIECVKQGPGQENHHEADGAQGAQVFQDTVEGIEGALVAQDDDVAMFRVCVCVNVGWICLHPEATKSELDQGADGDGGNCFPRYHQLPHHSAWNSDLKARNSDTRLRQ